MTTGKPGRLPLLERVEKDISEFPRIAKRIEPYLNSSGSHDWIMSDFPRTTQTKVRMAERIKLDPGFVRMAVNLATKAAYDLTLLERLVELARAPFKLTWFEWDAEEMFQERLRNGTMKALADDRPKHLGCFIASQNEEGTLWHWHSWADSDQVLESSPSFLEAVVSTEGALPSDRTPPMEWRGVKFFPDTDTRENRSHLLIGAFRGDHLSVEEHPVLDHVQVGVCKFILGAFLYQGTRDRSDAYEMFKTSILEMRGALRFLICVLALMNCAVIQYRTDPLPPGRRIVGGRTAPYLAHRTVTIHVPPGIKNVVKYLVKQVTDRHHRAHMVRGHWRNGYVRIRRGKEQVVKGSWVKPHQRGDASLGFVHQEYEVTAR